VAPHVRPPFAAYLRAYEPLAAFDRPWQLFWRRYVKEGRAVATADGPDRQRMAVLASLGIGATRLADLPEDAYVLQEDEAMLICPWKLRVRVAEAALNARRGVPSVLADAFVPKPLASAAETVLARWRADAVADGAVPRLHEHISTWNVPIRWFVFVDLDEREMALRSGRRLLRYRTPISSARRRAHRALNVLRRSVGDTPITTAVEEGARWLEEFHPRSVVELDYGGLVNVLDDETLRADDSPALVAEGLAGLARGDLPSATRAYEGLVERWRTIQLMERSN